MKPTTNWLSANHLACYLAPGPAAFVTQSILGNRVHTLITFLFGCCYVTTAWAAPSASSAAMPKFERGIWASKHYEEVTNALPRQSQEHILNRCVDPAESIRRGMLSAEKDGCEIKLDSKTPYSYVYLSKCPAGTVRTTIETASPKAYKMTTVFPQVRHVQLGHWVQDCPTASNLALPVLKKGI